jgi:hypothetical protein
LSRPPPRTPDGRYIVVDGKSGPRLWRAANPHLPADEQRRLTRELMEARRAVRSAKGNRQALAAARKAVDAAKRALGERAALWWSDGTPDLSHRLVKNTCYAGWWEKRDSSE